MKTTLDRKVKRQRIKVQKKLSKMASKGRLRRHVKNKVENLRRQRTAPKERRQAEIREDWLLNRRIRENESADESDGESSLMMDMLDPDVPLNDLLYSKSNNKRRRKKGLGNDGDDEEMGAQELKEHLRSFLGTEIDEQELLPVKIGSKLVRRVKKGTDAAGAEGEVKSEPESEEEEEADEDDANGESLKEQQDALVQNEADLIEGMSDDELLAHRTKLFGEAESRVAGIADLVLMEPLENISKLRFLLQMATGEDLSPLIRETAQKLAVATLAELFVNIVPGYAIRPLTDAERTQKMRKETKRMAASEQALLNYYIKYLRLLEKNTKKLVGAGKKHVDESTFTAQFGFLCAKCLCRLIESCSHFNYAPNILTCLARLSLCPWERLLDHICSTLSHVFKMDFHLTISLHAVKAISTLVNRKKAYVPAKLIATFLNLNIQEIERKKSKSDEKAKMHQQQKSKRKRKYDKQIGKLETELKEAVAADTHSTKLRLATDIMRLVFLTYFRILKRMPQTVLLRPVLEGLSKFVHLINVEFYDDLIAHLGRLVEQKQLKVSETLHCVRTASLILTGEGQAIDVDLLTFYRALYNCVPKICFQQPDDVENDISLLDHSLSQLLVRRRKSVSLARVAAFAKRLALVGICLPSNQCTLAILLMIRRLFVTFAGLKVLIDPDTDEDTLVTKGNFSPDSSDPDHSNSLSTSLLDELHLFSKHPSPLVKLVALHLLNRLPFNGKFRLDAKLMDMRPEECFSLEDSSIGEKSSKYQERLIAFCKDRKMKFSSDTYCSTVCAFMRARETC